MPSLGSDTYSDIYDDLYGEAFVSPGGPPSFPRLIIEIAFTTTPMSTTPVWVDVASYVRRWDSRRGRSSELDRVSAGNLTLLLDNRDRQFDPLNTAGDFYGYLLPNRRIRVRAESLGVRYPVFDGFIDNWEQGYEFRGDQTCVVSATDGFKRLAGITLPPKETSAGVANPDALVRPMEGAGARINAILNFAKVAWPAGQRQIDAGLSVLAAKTYDGGSALDALFDVDTTEQGRMFIGADGNFVFRDRNSMVTATTFTTSQADFADTHAGTTIPYVNPTMEHSDRLIRNDIVVTNETWGAYTAADTASQAAYGTVSYPLTLLDASSQASKSTADNLLALYKDPKSRVAGLRIKPRRTTAGWPDGLFPAILPLELGNRTNFSKQPIGGGPAIDQDYWIDEIVHTYEPGWWETDLRLGLARDAESYWIWGTGEWGTAKWAW